MLVTSIMEFNKIVLNYRFIDLLAKNYSFFYQIDDNDKFLIILYELEFDNFLILYVNH